MGSLLRASNSVLQALQSSSNRFKKPSVDTAGYTSGINKVDLTALFSRPSDCRR